MKIEVWSDFVCPLCYIGKRHLEEALKLFNQANHVIIEYKSYEIAPNYIVNSHQNNHEIIADIYNVSIEQAKSILDELHHHASIAGVTHDLGQMRPGNTFSAHRLAKYASKQKKGHEMIERLLRAYLMEGVHLEDHDILIQLAIDVGLAQEKVTHVLSSSAFEAKVRCDQIEAEQIGIENVPFYIFGEKYAVSGVQSVEVLLDVMEKVWEELGNHKDTKIKELQKKETTYCSGESCYEQKDTRST